MENTYLISVKTSPTNWELLEVPYEVYVYIRQLENAVKFEETREKLKLMYPERF